ncbi:MAG: LUD domain-containing protein [Chloroflexi bacterium]|nr:LUD domain-containing protein [Chloroflexota bacterium]
MAVEGLVGASLWSVFTQKAELVGAVVMRTASPATAAVLLREATTDLRCTPNAERRFPELAAAQTHQSPAADPATDVVALGEYAIAETGSIVLDEPAPGRGACFLAERLWLLIAEREIVPTLDLGMVRMRELVRAGSRHPLLMTGPSRTADIERVLTIGVHGPKALVVVMVGNA